MNFGNRFKRYRLRAGLSQTEAAALIGVNNYQLGNYETNRSEPKIEVLKKMSKIYKVTIDELVGNFNADAERASSIEKEKAELRRVLKEFEEYLGEGDK